jgi:hypothetical protein
MPVREKNVGVCNLIRQDLMPSAAAMAWALTGPQLPGCGQLSKPRMSDALIVQKIKKKGQHFDLFTNQLI